MRYENSGLETTLANLQPVDLKRWYFVLARIEMKANGQYYYVGYLNGVEMFQKELLLDSYDKENVYVIPFSGQTPCNGASLKNINYGYQNPP